jgi:predicted DCC family thiol-disulfide oxidoreductase YuxK
VFMRILLWDLNLLYLSFFDLARFCRWIGRTLFPAIMHVIYDDGCLVCRRTVAVLRVLDVFRRVEFVGVADRAELNRLGLAHLTEEQLLTDMHAVVGERMWRGFAAYRQIGIRIPPLWLPAVVCSVPPMRTLGDRVYRGFAATRHCQLEAPAPAAVSRRNGSSPAWRVAAIGAVLIVLNAVAGWRGITSWPITVYPTFACCVATTATLVTMEFDGPDGQLQTVTSGQADPTLPIGSERLRALTLRVLGLEDRARREEALRALAAIYGETTPALSEASLISFYKDEFSVAPETRGEPALRRELVFQLSR